MALRRRFLAGLLLAVGLLAGLHWLREHVEMAMLRVAGPHRDHFTRVFVVDDPPVVWVRAERPDRLWLDALRGNPQVGLERAGVLEHYRAEPWEGEDARGYVDGLFRRKYGAVDWLAGLVWRRNPVPVRLERRS